jgi:NAD(P)-dependent dehydrogenase (short-subunit alcohol dehydrogenase family)
MIVNMILEKFNLRGKTAIVTGGGTGLGKVMCHALAEGGADIVVASRNSGPINGTAEEVIRLGRRAIAVPTDVTESPQVDRLVERAIKEFGKIDILINNAGIARGIESSPRDPVQKELGPIWEITDAMWHQAIDVNLTSAFYCCRAVARHMIERGSGKIINMASVGGLRAVRNNFTYCSAKAGLIMFTKTLAVSWARNNIQVNCIAPGVFPGVEVLPSTIQKLARFMPMGRCGELREIGPLAVFLGSQGSDYITGECFVVDGAGSVGYAPTGYAPILPIGMFSKE